ncbi:trypsin-like peptidase domain-containing protein [Massilia sp. IC2-477]|uniref:S1C family serine protease n=1 Tax=unclassified Massilia TaxID=2609279 RepID=UPI001D10E530|nr:MULTISPECIES: S1C family serine protease [unclassified Massilia]MCC2958449.1 trypsin-like peptidase domain-containing protein [Massilia sp. IC2-477]MCC2974733.1 trypsin-like peptidase domain-containing protein [Massilia sp. IC2-476]
MKTARLAAAVAFALAGLVHAQDTTPPPSPTPGTPPSPAVATPSATTAPALPAIENSVVKIFATVRRPDPYKPWSKQSPADVTGSGVIIEGKRILTNAHVVGYASQVEVQASQSGDKVSAKVIALARGLDLAVLELDDPSFFDKRPPVQRAAVLPDVREAVFAYGYPVGGNSLSTTRGIVSRVEFVGYGSFSSGLRIQIDAPINPGNSGGPVIAGDKMIGLAFSMAANAQNIGYVIPNEEIELFLKDVADGRYDGKPLLHDSVQTLENPALRQYLKIDKSVEGALVHRPYKTDASWPLKEGDIITHIGEYPIDNQGMVKLGANLRVRFQYRIQQLAKNGKVPMTVIRGGKPVKIEVPTSGPRPLLIPDLNGGYPSYFVYGPVVFTRATNEFLSFLASSAPMANVYAFNDSPLMTQRGDSPDAAREELVVISGPFFPHKLVTGYSNRFGSVVESVNGTRIRSLAHLVTVLRDLKDEFVVFKFDQRFGENLILPRKAALDATEGILSDNGIRTQGSEDMMKVWGGK